MYVEATGHFKRRIKEVYGVNSGTYKDIALKDLDAALELVKTEMLPQWVKDRYGR